MALTTMIKGSTPKDKEFKNNLLSVKPEKQDYYTMSGKQPFSKEYRFLAPSIEMLRNHTGLVGTAFDYLARFRISQFLKTNEGIRQLVGFSANAYIVRQFPKYTFEPGMTWVNELEAFVKKPTAPIENVLEIAVHLAKLEHYARARTPLDDQFVHYLMMEPAPAEVLADLKQLMNVFEETFMVPDIITKKSKVVFNPNFGTASLLVRGADADIYIVGTLYDFKTSKQNGYIGNDNLQMVGYYLLNEFAKATHSDIYEYNYHQMDIKRVAFYKARFGEIEVCDIQTHVPYPALVKPKMKELADVFKDDEKNLYFEIHGDAEAVKKRMEELRNGEE